MNMHNSEMFDLTMMRRCITLSESARSNGEYPYAAVITRRGEFVCEALNLVKAEGDVTLHAEMVAISSAQKKLGSKSLDHCTIYSTVEPCAMCCYAIRESRIGKVVFGLQSPVMGGNSRWNILTDRGLSSALPEVFAPPPDVLAGYLYHEVCKVFHKWNPLVWQFIKYRQIFVEHINQDPRGTLHPRRERGRWFDLTTWARAAVIDRFWRD